MKKGNKIQTSFFLGVVVLCLYGGFYSSTYNKSSTSYSACQMKWDTIFQDFVFIDENENPPQFVNADSDFSINLLRGIKIPPEGAKCYTYLIHGIISLQGRFSHISIYNPCKGSFEILYSPDNQSYSRNINIDPTEHSIVESLTNLPELRRCSEGPTLVQFPLRISP